MTLITPINTYGREAAIPAFIRERGEARRPCLALGIVDAYVTDKQP